MLADKENRPSSCNSRAPETPHNPKGRNTQGEPIGRIPCPAADGTLPPAEANALGTETPDRRGEAARLSGPAKLLIFVQNFRLI